MLTAKMKWDATDATFPHVHQPHLEVINGDLVLQGVAVGHRLEKGSMVTFGLQKLSQFLQHSRTVGSNCCVTSQVTLGNTLKLWEQLQGLWVLCE